MEVVRVIEWRRLLCGWEERKFREERGGLLFCILLHFLTHILVWCLDCFPLVIKFQAPVHETIDLKEKTD